MNSELSTELRPAMFLTPEQARRAECLRLALWLTAGRSVPIHVVWDIARWINNGVKP